ncbi:MAG: hypothetical protein DIU71_08370 [Proteobacteria bacterium]|nr:MAG: hypothetical protein DIU71_08370 [Pseudomonadota bacterium]
MKPRPAVGDLALARRAAWAAMCATLVALGGEASAGEPGSAQIEQARPVASALRYDQEYPVIGYSRTPVDNAIARLQERLDRGEVELEFKPTRGYFDSLLAALDIDPSSQILVYSKTSLQFLKIRARTPRAIYFNDDTYVAYVQDSDLIEIGVMDRTLGPVFYGLDNRRVAAPRFEREMSRCLTCHDRFSMTGGGVPLFKVLSVLVDVNGQALSGGSSIMVTDRSPIERRWGGWYVTGRHGSQTHLGNILVNDPSEAQDLEQVRRGNLDTLDGLFDTRPYLTNTSDIVALMVFEHQTTVQNLITRINFKARTFVANDARSGRWEDVSPKTRTLVQKMTEPLVQAMLFVGAAPLEDRFESTSGYDRWFEARGPRDTAGRSLRELELETRLFKYPMSYMVYSEAFDGLPDYAKAFIYERFLQILSGQDESAAYAHLSSGDRQAILEILTATKPDFAEFAARAAG